MSQPKAITVSDEYMPSLHLSESQIPELKKWRVGGRYRMVIDVEQTGANNNQDGIGDKNKKLSGTFRILSVTPVETTANKNVILKTLADKAKKA